MELKKNGGLFYEAHEKNPEKILRNANIDKDGNLIVKRADWTN